MSLIRHLSPRHRAFYYYRLHLCLVNLYLFSRPSIVKALLQRFMSATSLCFHFFLNIFVDFYLQVQLGGYWVYRFLRSSLRSSSSCLFLLFPSFFVFILGNLTPSRLSKSDTRHFLFKYFPRGTALEKECFTTGYRLLVDGCL